MTSVEYLLSFESCLADSIQGRVHHKESLFYVVADDLNARVMLTMACWKRRATSRWFKHKSPSHLREL